MEYATYKSHRKYDDDAYKKALASNLKILETHGKFFFSKKQLDKYEAIDSFINSYFKDCGKKWLNYRVYEGKPLRVIKLDNPTWPYRASKKKFYDGMKTLGAEVLSDDVENKHLIRIK